MDKRIKLRLGPKALEIFNKFVVSASVHAGPLELHTTEYTMTHEMDITTGEEKEYGMPEPKTIAVNRGLSNRLTGSLIKFIAQNVEIESKKQTR